MYAKNSLCFLAAALATHALAASGCVYAADSRAKARPNARPKARPDVSPKVKRANSAPFVLFQTLSAASPFLAPAPLVTAPPVTAPPSADAPGGSAGTVTPTPPAETDAPKKAVSVVIPLYYYTDAVGVLRILRRADAQPINETAYKGALSAVTSARRDVSDKEEARRAAYDALLQARRAAGPAQPAPGTASAAATSPAETGGSGVATLSGATQALEAAQQQLDAALADARVKEAAYAKETEAWEAGIYTSGDPIRRVYLRTAGPGLLFLRGDPKDIRKVRQALAEIDQPVPQMRVTLWTVQVNGQGAQGDGPSRQRLAAAVDQVEEDMGLLRQQLAACSDLFQKCVETQVHRAAISPHPGGEAPRNGESGTLPEAFYFYEPRVLTRLSRKGDEAGEAEPFSQASYLRPERANSLGETLLTLLLAKEEYRQAALQEYRRQAPALLARMHEKSLLRRGVKAEDIARLNLLDRYTTDTQMTRLLAAFGYRRRADDSLESLAGGATPDSVKRQQEYAVGIIRAALQQIHRRQALKHWDDLIATFQTNSPLAATDANARTVCDGVSSYFTAIASATAAGSTAHDDLDQALLDLNITDPQARKSVTEPPVKVTTPEQMEALRGAVEEKNAQGLAQMAVGDQIIKQFVVAAEDDLDTELIRPRLRQLQEDASQKSISLGIVQRTSVLAGDRRAARVDPRASIEFAFPKPADLLQESVDLVKLVAKGTGAGVAANLTALAGTGDAGKVLDKLVDISDHRQTPPPDIYKIETGSGFTLTPTLLPDAQNMAFDLDYSLSSPVTEPKDAKGRRTAQIERHGLQTYVQDGSYELRELSRFESDVKLAQPVIRSGGLPLLREIPGVRDIPVLGYFSKSAGAGMGLQESLIFVHSVQYPTVKALIPLF